MKTLNFARLTTLAIGLGVASMSANAAQVERAFTPATRYNLAGQVTGTIAPDPDGSGPLGYLATRNTYDSRGFLVKIERGELSAWLDETVAPQNWNNSATFSIVKTSEATYDSFGRMTSKLLRGTDGTIESLVQFSYGPNNLLQCEAVRMNPAVFANPPAGVCTAGEGPYGRDRISRYAYGSFDLLVSEERAVGDPVLHQAYVTNTYEHRLLKSQTDANGNRTELRYDGYGRLWRRVYPNPSAPGSVNEADYNEYTYYANGTLHTERKRDGTTITYTPDGNNRPVLKNYSDPAMQDVYYNYDLRGLNLYSRFGSDTGPGETNQYNGFGQLATRTSDISGTARPIHYRYDPNGNRTRVTHPDGFFFEYEFDGLNRVNGVASSDSSSPTAPTTSLLSVTYASDGKRHSIVRPAGMTTIYLRDNAQRLDSFTQSFPNATDSLENVFQYNPAGQIRALIQGNDQYNFREVANRTGVYVPNGLNQYGTINGAPLSYDAKGNLTADGGMTYIYDMENRLIGTEGSVFSTLSYDPLGRLASYTADGTTSQFLYDGDALIGEYVSGSLRHRYVHGDQVDEPWVQYNGAGVAATDRRFLFADHQGSVIVQASNSGLILAKSAYDPFGTPAAANIDRFGYTGQTWLKELGLNYYKARIYSPKLGRFLQTDPIFYEDSMNVYAYVGNDPVSNRDTSGKSCNPGPNCPKREPKPKEPPKKPEQQEEELPEIVVTATKPKKVGIGLVNRALCAMPAFTFSLEAQVDGGWGIQGHSANAGYRVTSHGQVAVYYEHGATKGAVDAGAMVGIGTSVGVSTTDMPEGVSSTKEFSLGFKGATGLSGGGGNLDLDDAGGEISFGMSYNAGYGAFVHGGVMTGQQFSSPSICVNPPQPSASAE